MLERLLDTNVVSSLLRGNRRVATQFRFYARASLGVPAVALSELWTGFLGAHDANTLIANWQRLDLSVLPLDASDAVCSGEVRSQLYQLGQPIGPLDSLIAGQALARNLTLVTHNTREFSRVPGLRLEDWEA